MAYLFEINGTTVQPTPEVLQIEPFKRIWRRDKDRDKKLALKEFAYIEFMSSVRNSNPYSSYPEDLRHEVIVKDLFSKKYPDWKPDKLISEGIEKVNEFQTNGSVSYTYYISAKRAVEKLQSFFNTVNLNERNSNGIPIYKPADITKAVNDTEKVIQNLTALKKKVDEELFESTRTRGGKEISPFAIPDVL